jgi:DNA-binding response OmpR family regulator
MGAAFPSPRVLVIDSNPGLRSVFTSELEEAGYSTLGAESTDDAKRFAQDDRPEAIVLNATWAPEAAIRLISDLRTTDGLSDVPIVGIAWVQGREQRLLNAGADCCIRHVPARGDILKAVEWALAMYADRRSP